MNSPDPLDTPLLQNKALLWLLIAVSLLFLAVLWPLSGALSWALFMAIVFAPLQERSAFICHGRRGWAAFGTLVVIIVSVLLPTALLAASVTHEAAAFYARFKSGEIQVAEYFQRFIDILPAWMRAMLDRVGIGDLGTLQARLVEALGASSKALTSRVVLIGQGTLDFVVSLFVMLYVLFFFLRDGKSLAQQTAQALPLEPRHTRRLLSQFATVVRATVKGNVVVALVQGALGGLAFWVLGISGALLWGALMALLSLLPAVGAALVWGPVAIYLAGTGSAWQAIALALWGVLVIGLVDNVLRPILVGKDTRMPDYLVLISTLGGLAVFGLNGFVIGPVIAAMFIATWDIFMEARNDPPAQKAAPSGSPELRRRRRRAGTGSGSGSGTGGEPPRGR